MCRIVSSLALLTALLLGALAGPALQGIESDLDDWPVVDAWLEDDILREVQGTPCSNSRDIFPCTCVNSTSARIYVTCNGILEEATVHRALHTPGYGPTPLAGFTMSWGTVKTISKDLFSENSFQQVSLENNHIEYIEPGALDPLSDYITSLYLGHNALTQPFFDMVLGFRKLANVVQSYNLIEDISSMASYNGSNTNVLGLGLGGNLIQSLPARAFQSFPNVILLNLSDNKINYIHPDAFYNLGQLSKINLGYNNLNQLGSPDVGWVLVPRPIREVSLEGNNITSLVPGFVKGLGDPSIIVLDNNPIRSFPEEVFGELMRNFSMSNVPYQGITMFHNWIDCDCEFLWVALEGGFGEHLRGGHCGHLEDWPWVRISDVDATALQQQCEATTTANPDGPFELRPF